MSSPKPIVRAFVLTLLAAGCNLSNDAELAQAKAEADAARTEAQAARAELVKARSDADAARAEAQAASAKAPAADPDPERRAVEWVRQQGGLLDLQLIEGGYPFPVKPSDQLPEKPYRIESVNFVNNPKQIDQGLARLEGVSIGRVHLSASRLTDAGLTHVKRIHGVWELALQDTAVTDAGLEHLKEMTKLSHLFLDGTNVSDTGLACLASLPNLHLVSLARTPVTDAGIEKLKRSVPKVKINK
jgi:hypothetical protein